MELNSGMLQRLPFKDGSDSLFFLWVMVIDFAWIRLAESPPDLIIGVLDRLIHERLSVGVDSEIDCSVIS